MMSHSETQMHLIERKCNSFKRVHIERKCKCKRKLARERKRASVKRKILRARFESRSEIRKLANFIFYS